MRFVYNNKIYDTEKSEIVIEYITGKIKVILCITSFGEWFYLCTERGHQDARPLDAKYAKRILENRNRHDLIVKYFGDI